ncbi:Aminoacyl-tRNA synthetase class 1a anticodon-binding [Penicillium cosmopolitanum]|uniref:leucine--tRNA ligase n=1 Tax=Penicillium cosmopolitanum TaxID=1131564 RepID=A0A9X0BA30_9EURO|nr:Aminoacyl-tRNA synthetase class 1a anticodon-binding [Penicillium cosmopolitanum]KAJ5397323.1 Aminoacyl-tRNA synthetase class 1a anticodon-binding [Penicillium cosmopolitanum]
MPEGLPIDHEQALNGTMAAYAQQLVICTDQRDWTSRIENDGENKSWGDLPFNNVLVSTSSIVPATNSPFTASALLFPSFKYIPSIPVEAGTSSTGAADLTSFVRAFLLPERLHNMHSSLPEAKRTDMTRAPELSSHFDGVLDINHSPTILICGHGGRDLRCGVMAPALESEFQRVLQAQGYKSAGGDGTTIDGPNHANIGLISHVGGHKYAGNVIIYIPPKMTVGTSAEPHPLAAHARSCARPHQLRFPLASNTFTRLATTSSTPRRLDLPALDKKWQEKWQSDATLNQLVTEKSTESKPQTYVLSMFPYPSGTLHMGHVRVYTISDVLSRFYKMRGHDVLHPMGWDAFGLPAENAAIERGIDPAEWTEQNMAKMKEQLRGISTSFNWDRELATCSPEFYAQTQRIFLMLYEKGLAYQSEALVNYDPVDKTVLANEQVDANGFSWRSGAKVEKLNLKQWFFRITQFKEELLKDLDSLSGGWPERVLSMQRNWLGKSQGAKVRFPVTINGEKEVDVGVFTTRPDTLYGVEYLALSLNHPIVLEAAEKDPSLRKFLDEAALLHRIRRPVMFSKAPRHRTHFQKSTKKLPTCKGSYRFLRHQNMNPESIPIVINSDPLKSQEGGPVESVIPARDATAFTQEGFLSSRCGKYQDLSSKEATKQIVTDLKKVGQAEFMENWRLRDWLISRQRYWGAPIPIIHCGGCGPVPVPVKDLPVKLPKIEGDWLKGKKGNPLESSEEFLHTNCPSCGGPAKRDTDTMDTFVDSSWYYLRFLDPRNKDAPFSPSVARPVDFYIGGVEHAILHLLYARFIYKFLAESDQFPAISQDKGLAAPAEPFKTLLSQGMVHGKTFIEPSTGRFLHPSEVDISDLEKPLIKGTQITPNISFEKMSKSKHNGVDPTDCTTKYGADATRAQILFAAPVSEVLEWDEAKIVGIERWFGRLWKLVIDARETLNNASFTISASDLDASNSHAASLPHSLEALSDSDADAILATHKTIISITSCIENNPYGLNTVVSDLTKLTNALVSAPPSSPLVLYLTISALLRLLSPIAPALTSESWEVLHKSLVQGTSPTAVVPSIHASSWPTPLLSSDQADALSARGGQTVAIQINGKMRCAVNIPRMKSTTPTTQGKKSGPTLEEQDWIINHVLDTTEGKFWLKEKNDWEKRRRVIVVKGGKLVNVVF